MQHIVLLTTIFFGIWFIYVSYCWCLQGREKRIQSKEAMEHWKRMLATMFDRQEKFLNSRRSRMPKTVTFLP